MPRRSIRSAAVIAKLLACEGFTDHLAGEIKRYWYAACCRATPQSRRRILKAKRAFTELVKAKLTDTDRLILGKWMSVFARMQFETGLRLGLMAHAQENAKDIPDDWLCEDDDHE